jgi:hypothetical protein
MCSEAGEIASACHADTKRALSFHLPTRLGSATLEALRLARKD